MKKIWLVLMMTLISFCLCGCSTPKEEIFTLSVNELNDVYAVGEEIVVIGSITNNSLWSYTIGSGVSLIKIYSDEYNPVEFALLYSRKFYEHEVITKQSTLTFATPGAHTIYIICWFTIDEVRYQYTQEYPVIIQSMQEG